MCAVGAKLDSVHNKLDVEDACRYTRNLKIFWEAPYHGISSICWALAGARWGVAPEDRFWSEPWISPVDQPLSLRSSRVARNRQRHVLNRVLRLLCDAFHQKPIFWRPPNLESHRFSGSRGNRGFEQILVLCYCLFRWGPQPRLRHVHGCVRDN